MMKHYISARIAAPVLTALLPVLLYCSTAQAAPPDGYRLVWQDLFQGEQLDLSRWTPATYLRDAAQLTADAVSVDAQGLHIRTYSGQGQHYSGFLSTAGKYSFRYGYTESRIRFQDAPGGHCAFWLQSPTLGKWIGDPQRSGVEIDIIEHRLTDMKGKDVSQLASFNLHWDGYREQHQHLGGKWQSPVSLDGSWHTYGLLWTPQEYVFYVDGTERWRTTQAISQVAQEIRLTCELKDRGWAGPLLPQGYGTREQSPYRMDVEWVKVWQQP
ncbi:MAG: glycoside hydrolase family 16 protein [Undibacterium curvum]|uniref:glycoside hydrolase family 16 protein n=1 Tax=Undibacterium curvum TaxID=2762294 RepID=UPI003BCBEA83